MKRKFDEIDNEIERQPNTFSVNAHPWVCVTPKKRSIAPQMFDNPPTYERPSFADDAHEIDGNRSSSPFPGDYVTHARVMIAAQALIQLANGSGSHTSSEPESDDNYLFGPRSQRQENSTTGSSQHKVPSKTGRNMSFKIPGKSVLPKARTPTQATPPAREIMIYDDDIDERVMMTAERAPTSRQKILPGFPHPEDPFPKDFGLPELCHKYPNHLFGANLYRFVQQGWTAGQVMANLPSQAHIPSSQRLTRTAMAGRLRTARIHMGRAEKDESSPSTSSAIVYPSSPSSASTMSASPAPSSGIYTELAESHMTPLNDDASTDHISSSRRSAKNSIPYSPDLNRSRPASPILLSDLSSVVEEDEEEEIPETDDESDESQYTGCFTGYVKNAG